MIDAINYTRRDISITGENGYPDAGGVRDFDNENLKPYVAWPGNVIDPYIGRIREDAKTLQEDVSEHTFQGDYGDTTTIVDRTKLPRKLPDPVIKEDIMGGFMAGIDPKMLLFGIGAIMVGYLMYKIL